MRRNDANSFSVITSHIISSQFAIHDKKFPTKYYSHFAIASVNETAARICKKYCWMPGNNRIESTYCINSWWKNNLFCVAIERLLEIGLQLNYKFIRQFKKKKNAFMAKKES